MFPIVICKLSKYNRYNLVIHKLKLSFRKVKDDWQFQCGMSQDFGSKKLAIESDKTYHRLLDLSEETLAPEEAPPPERVAEQNCC